MTTVFTCGVFDLLHWGHVSFLERAAELGDKLIVGVNSDAQARHLKGPGRPIWPAAVRCRMLLALECVYNVKEFAESDPCALIRRLRPDVVVKGSEYSHSNAPEAKLIESMGGRFVVLDSLPIHTTDILRRIESNRS